MKWLSLLALITLAGCSSMPNSSDAENGVVCWEGEGNASWPAVSTNGRTNGVWLDSDVDVTQVSPEQWIALYEAFCRPGR